MYTMSATPPPRWYNLIQTCLRKEPGPVSRFVQLATLSLDGHPAVRTVVFRGWHSTPSPSPSPSSPSSPPPSSTDLALMTTTDTRSQKMSELNAHPFAEICWYFQVRDVSYSFMTQSSTIQIQLWSQQMCRNLGGKTTVPYNRQRDCCRW